MRGDSNLTDSGFYKIQRTFQGKNRFLIDKLYNEIRNDEIKKQDNIFQRFISWLKSKLLNK
jgi:hypothetical protein